MKLYDGGLTIAFIIVAAIGITVIANDYFGAKDDNILEEVAEEAIEWATGLDVDLTPLSPEEEASLQQAYERWRRDHERTNTRGKDKR